MSRHTRLWWLAALLADLRARYWQRQAASASVAWATLYEALMWERGAARRAEAEAARLRAENARLNDMLNIPPYLLQDAPPLSAADYAHVVGIVGGAYQRTVDAWTERWLWGGADDDRR
jgi:hypothetical protein